MELNMKYVGMTIMLMGMGVLYRRYLDKYDKNQDRDYNLIKKYLLNDSSVAKTIKPMLWIHIPYEINSRAWESFNSRNTKDLNQPYLYLTIESIIRNCGNDFNVCLIDDQSFHTLLPEWSIDLSKVGNPIKEKIRHLAICKLLYNYGGMLVPKSFLCIKNMSSIYKDYTTEGKMFLFEKKASNLGTNTKIIKRIQLNPDITFFGARKGNVVLKKYCLFLENLISHDYTDDSNIQEKCNHWMEEEFLANNSINIVSGKINGTKNKWNKQILLEDLFEENYPDFDESMHGLCINDEELLSRKKYNWFCYLHEDSILSPDLKNTLGIMFNKALNK